MAYKVEERELHIWYDPVDNRTNVYTNNPKSMTKFRKSHWTIVREEVENGRVISVQFAVDGFPMTARDILKTRKGKQVNDEEGEN